MFFNDYFQALEFKKLSRVLSVSCSTDDIGIRKNLELVKGGRIIGYEDLGPDPAVVDLGGGPTETPASHVMVFMVTATSRFLVHILSSQTNSKDKVQQMIPVLFYHVFNERLNTIVEKTVQFLLSLP